MDIKKYINNEFKKYLYFLFDTEEWKRSEMGNIYFVASFSIILQQIMANIVPFACEPVVNQSIDKNLNFLNPRSTYEYI